MQLLRLLHRAGFMMSEVRELGPRFTIGRLGGALRSNPARCPVNGVGDVMIRPGTSDTAVFNQVFRDRQYDLSHFPQADRVRARYNALLDAERKPVIIDCGANNGASSLWFRNLFPAAMILAIEPDPANAKVCRTNTSGHDVRVIEAAIGSRSGSVQIRDKDAASWAVQTVRTESADAVPVVTIPDLLADQGASAALFIVKIDIEGFEDDLFAGDVAWLDDVSVLYIEPHDWMLPDRKTSRGFQIAMGERDFDILVAGENLIYIR